MRRLDYNITSYFPEWLKHSRKRCKFLETGNAGNEKKTELFQETRTVQIKVQCKDSKQRCE